MSTGKKWSIANLGYNLYIGHMAENKEYKSWHRRVEKKALAEAVRRALSEIHTGITLADFRPPVGFIPTRPFTPREPFLAPGGTLIVFTRQQ